MAKKVLIVDDVAFARKLIGKILTDAKYQIAGEASNGEEAVEAFVKLMPDLVTMDIVMPKKNGIEACRQIIENFPEAKIIIVSAMTHEQLIMDAINAGARDYIMKPFAPEDLLRTLEKLFEGEDDDGLSAGASHGAG